MERLIKDAEQLDATFVANRDTNGELTMSYADIVDAIHIVQTQMGITGTTAKEASTTIEGSVNSMKASWKNLITGLGNSNADLGQLVGNFTDSLETAFDNILPVVENAITSMAEALPTLVGRLLPKVVTALNDMLPGLLNSVTDLINSIAKQLPSMVGGIVKTLPDLLQNIFSNIGEIAGNLLPALADSLINVFANLPAMLAGAVGGIVDGISNLVSGIVDGIKKQAENSVPDDLADGYVGRIKSNFEKTFYDGFLNLQSSVAKIIGDTEWADAVKDLKLASELESKIISDYNTAMENMSQYSFENFEAETEVKINNAMSLLGALDGYIDEDGNVTGDITIVQSYIDQINNLLGDPNAVTLEETPADWIIQITDKYKDAEGNITNPEGLRQEIESELNKLFGGQSVDLNETTYNAVSKVLTNYSQSDAMADLSGIRQAIMNELDAAGIDHVEGFDSVQAFVDSIINEGSISTWYGTNVSSGWQNSGFIAQLQSEGKLPTPDNPEQVDAVADLVVKVMLGEITEEEFQEQIASLDLPPEVEEQTINYTVNKDQVDEAVESFKELTRQKYESMLADAYVDASITNMTNYNQALKEAETVQTKFQDGISGKELQAFSAEVNNASLAINSQREAAEEMHGTYYDLMGGVEGYTSKEEYIRHMLETDQAYQEQIVELEALRAEEERVTDQVYATAGSFGALDADAKELMSSLALSATSWVTVGQALGLTEGQARTLAETSIALWDEYGRGTRACEDATRQWAFSSAEAQAIADSMGISVDQLSYLMFELGRRGEVTSESIDDFDVSTYKATESADLLGETVTETGDEISAAGDKAKEGGEKITTGVKDGIDEAEKAIDESEVPTKVEKFFDGVSTEPTKTKFRQMGESVEEVNTGISNIEQKVYDKISGLESGMHSEMSALEGDMTSSGESGGSGLDSGFGRWNSIVLGTVNSMYNLFHVAFMYLAGDMWEYGYNAGSKFKSGLDENYDNIVSVVQSITDSVDFGFAGLYQDLYVSGYDAGVGFYNGLSAWSWEISNLAWDIANSINAAASAALDINSPSRVLRKTLGYAGEGMYLGLADWRDSVVGEAESIADGIETALNGDYGANFGDYGGVTSSIDASTTAKINEEQQVLALLQKYLPQLANMNVVLDKGETVGKLMPEIDKQMQKAETMENRGASAYA